MKIKIQKGFTKIFKKLTGEKYDLYIKEIHARIDLLEKTIIDLEEKKSLQSAEILELRNQLEKQKNQLDDLAASQVNNINDTIGKYDDRINKISSISDLRDHAISIRLNSLESKFQRNISNYDSVAIAPRTYQFFAQFGEDKWIYENLNIPTKGVFVDVGAADGVLMSNTYFFELNGWDGICIEPDPRNFLEAKKYRKRVENIAISQIEGELDFYMSSFTPDWSGLTKSTDKDEVVKVKSTTLEKVLIQNKITEIDLLSIDTE